MLMLSNDQGILQFKDYLPVAPSRPVGKLYDVKVEAIVATADQIKRLTASGLVRPSTAKGKSLASAPKVITTRGVSSASLTAGGATVPPPTPDASTAASIAESPAASPDNSLVGSNDNCNGCC